MNKIFAKIVSFIADFLKTEQVVQPNNVRPDIELISVKELSRMLKRNITVEQLKTLQRNTDLNNRVRFIGCIQESALVEFKH